MLHSTFPSHSSRYGLIDHQFANPAFAALQQESSAGLRTVYTGFENGPDVTSLQVHYTLPLKPNRQGLQVTFLTLDSSTGETTLPLAGPVAVDMAEQALVVDYGQRLAEHLTAGLSVLGYQHVDLKFASAAGPVLMDLGDRAAYGFRGGLAYEWAPGDTLGALVCFSRDKVNTSGVATAPGSDFDSSQLVIGASRHLTPRLLVAGEFQRGVSSTTGLRSTSNTWHWGAEYQATPSVALRAGLSDGSLCWGLGWGNARWRADYAFISDWNEESTSALFGGSDTHSLGITANW